MLAIPPSFLSSFFCGDGEEGKGRGVSTKKALSGPFQLGAPVRLYDWQVFVTACVVVYVRCNEEACWWVFKRARSFGGKLGVESYDAYP